MLKLTIKKLELRQWRPFDVYIVTLEQVLHIALVFAWLTLDNEILARIMEI